MSRIGKKAVPIPSGVTANVDGQTVKVKGPKGALQLVLHDDVSAKMDKGGVKIHRIIAATDPGHVVNPAQVERQIAGSFVYGLSALFYQECTVKNGRIEQTNFDTYDSMRISEMPKVECIIMPSGGFWGGVGEPTIAVAAPAVLNAIAAATGKRIRNFPLKDNDLNAA